MENERLKSVLESLLFVSGEPLRIARLAKAAGTDEKAVEETLSALAEDYAAADRGLMIIRKDESAELATNPANAESVAELIKGEMQESLSQAALEVLSIVAYRGPIARSEIEAIRGVNCSFTLRSLLMRSLIERIDNPKDSRGYLYRVSFRFLESLGVENVEKLPDWESLSRDPRIDSVLGKAEAEPESAKEGGVEASESEGVAGTDGARPAGSSE